MLLGPILINVIRFLLSDYSIVSTLVFFIEGCFSSAKTFRQKAYIIHTVWFLVMQDCFAVYLCVYILYSSLSSSSKQNLLIEINAFSFQNSTFSFSCRRTIVIDASAFVVCMVQCIRLLHTTRISKRYAFV